MGAPFYIGMMVPFILIYVFNWIIFTIIITSICYKNWYNPVPKYDSQSQKSGVSPRQQFMIAIMLSVLFGIGWGIGLLATEELGSKAARDFFASLFVIITSFHGLLIFILHCARSKDARREWRRWFFKATNKELSDFTSSTYGYIQHNLKTSSLRPLILSSSSKTTKKFEIHSSTASPFFSMTGDGRTLKLNVMKQREWDSLYVVQTAEEGTYDLATEPELDTDFTKVDLAKMEAKQESISEVNSYDKSTVQRDDVLQEDPFAVTVTLSDPEDGEPRVNQLFFEKEGVEMKPKEVQQDEERSLEEPIPKKLKEAPHAEDATSVTNLAPKMKPKEVQQDEQRSLEEPMAISNDELKEQQCAQGETSVTNSALDMVLPIQTTAEEAKAFYRQDESKN